MTIGELLEKLSGPEYVGTIPVYIVDGVSGDLCEIAAVAWVAATPTQPEMIVIEGGASV